MHRRRGYVLVVTLAVLVLASTLLVTLGRSAMRHAADARAATTDLQSRWGSASCRQTILPLAERLLETEERRTGRPTPTLSRSLRLGGQTFDLILADEQAKADVNALLLATEATAAESRIRQALSGYGLANKVRLRPDVALRPRVADPSAPPAIGGYGQVFDDVPADALLRRPIGGGPAPAELLTCWGGGRINLRRASEPALRLALSPPMTAIEIGRLIDLRDRAFFGESGTSPIGPTIGGRGPLRRIVESAALTGESARAASMLSDGSTRHSLWIIATSPGRRDVSFAVLDTSEIDLPRWTVRQ